MIELIKCKDLIILEKNDVNQVKSLIELTINTMLKQREKIINEKKIIHSHLKKNLETEVLFLPFLFILLQRIPEYNNDETIINSVKLVSKNKIIQK